MRNQSHQPQSRAVPAPGKPPRNARRGRVREANAPVRRGREAADESTRLEVAAASERTTVVPAANRRDLDAPVATRRELFEEHVRVQVVTRLADHEVDHWPIHVSIEGARVELYGVVPDALTSQLAEDLVWSVPAVRQCDNRLRIG